MSKVAGLVCIVFGLCVLVIWFYLPYEIESAFWNYEYPKTVSAVVIQTLRDTPGTFLQTPWSFVAVVGLVLIGIGISCLVHSFRKSSQ
jgi:uncharacterized membrane protein HdeD (DUF308 family)